jgi:hypothetical protein
MIIDNVLLKKIKLCLNFVLPVGHAGEKLGGNSQKKPFGFLFLEISDNFFIFFYISAIYPPKDEVWVD